MLYVRYLASVAYTWERRAGDFIKLVLAYFVFRLGAESYASLVAAVGPSTSASRRTADFFVSWSRTHGVRVNYYVILSLHSIIVDTLGNRRAQERKAERLNKGGYFRDDLL